MKPPSAVLPVAALLVTASLAWPARGGELTSVGVEFSRIERQMQIGASTNETRVTTLGARIGERLVPGLTLEMPIGHAELVQPDNPASAGRRPTGGYLGVGARWEAAVTESVRFLGRFEYTYHRLDLVDDTNREDYEIDWYQASLLAGIGLDRGVWSVAAGAGVESLEGDETDPSAARTSRVTADDGGFGWLGIDLRTGRAESLALRIEQGGRRGLSLQFRKGF